MNESDHPQGGLTYRDAGVDIDAGNALVERIKPAVASTLRPEVLTGLGGFGGLFGLDPAKYEDPVLVAGTDGVGTKLLLARQLDRHDTIGIDLVAMCVNDILACGAEPLFFLDYFATGRIEPGQAQTVIEGIAEGCRQAGCALIGGETAEMPGLYGAGCYDLAGFAVGVVERSRVIDGSGIRAGHRLIGLPSSGPHSNGYSLIRKVLDLSAADTNQAFDAGAGSLTTLGEALLAPTRIYVDTVRGLMDRFPLAGLAHITGGGLTENVIRVVPTDLGITVDLAAWRRPAIFDWLQEAGRISGPEMLRTFNCGIGMVLVVDEADCEPMLAHLRAAGEDAVVIGEVHAAAGDGRVTWQGQ